MESGKTLHIPLSNVLSRIYSANHAPDPDQSENRCDADGLVSSFGPLHFVQVPSMPLGEVAIITPRAVDAVLRGETPPAGSYARLVNLNRECGQGAEGGCELGLGHPGGECMGRGSRGEYLVWEQGTGRLLREL